MRLFCVILYLWPNFSLFDECGFLHPICHFEVACCNHGILSCSTVYLAGPGFRPDFPKTVYIFSDLCLWVCNQVVNLQKLVGLQDRVFLWGVIKGATPLAAGVSWWDEEQMSYVPRFGSVPSVLWYCWLGERKGMWPIKNLCHLSLSLGSFEECIEEETEGDQLAKDQLEYGH